MKNPLPFVLVGLGVAAITGLLTLQAITATCNESKRVEAFVDQHVTQRIPKSIQEQHMTPSIKPVELLTKVGIVVPSAKVQVTENEGGFQTAMANALKETSGLQKQSGQLSREFTLENPTVSLEQTMLAGVKSNIAFQTTLQVRNKLVQSYSDIMNMQI